MRTLTDDERYVLYFVVPQTACGVIMPGLFTVWGSVSDAIDTRLNPDDHTSFAHLHGNFVVNSGHFPAYLLEMPLGRITKALRTHDPNQYRKLQDHRVGERIAEACNLDMTVMQQGPKIHWDKELVKQGIREHRALTNVPAGHLVWIGKGVKLVDAGYSDDVRGMPLGWICYAIRTNGTKTHCYLHLIGEVGAEIAGDPTCLLDCSVEDAPYVRK